MVSIIRDDLQIVGHLEASTMDVPAGAVTTDSFSASTGDRLAASKQVHHFPVLYQQDAGSDVVAATAHVHIAKGAGTIVAVEVVSATVPVGGTEKYTVDVQKGDAAGAYTTILSSTEDVSVADGSVDRTIQTATLAVTVYADGDQFKVVIAVSGSGGAQAKDLMVVIWLQENPS